MQLAVSMPVGTPREVKISPPKRESTVDATQHTAREGNEEKRCEEGRGLVWSGLILALALALAYRARLALALAWAEMAPGIDNGTLGYGFE